MTKAATNRQIETAGRELNRAIADVAEAWRQHEPYPTWEQEQEWMEMHPSPRTQHARIEKEVIAAWRHEADGLLLQITMGEISSEDCYARLKELLDRMHEVRLGYLKTA